MGAHQGTPTRFIEFAQKASGEPPGTLYTYAEIAAAMKVSVQTVEVWVKRGRIPSPIYIGSTARFTYETLLEIKKGVGKDHSYPIADSPRATAIKAAKHRKRLAAERASRRHSSDHVQKKIAHKLRKTKPKKGGA